MFKTSRWRTELGIILDTTKRAKPEPAAVDPIGKPKDQISRLHQGLNRLCETSNAVFARYRARQFHAELNGLIAGTP
ncbi:MAG: hypothetical protein ACJAXT_000715 [Paracoccaceae bacterium]|jgi:hypothetical protein